MAGLAAVKGHLDPVPAAVLGGKETNNHGKPPGRNAAVRREVLQVLHHLRR